MAPLFRSWDPAKPLRAAIHLSALVGCCGLQRTALSHTGAELLLVDDRIPAEDVTDGVGLGPVHHELAILDSLAEWRKTAHPHALLLRCCDLVANPLARDFALELGEREQHVERQPAHRRGRVELLRDGNERHALGVEGVDDLGEIAERACQPVDLIDDDCVDVAGTDLGQHSLQRRAFQRATRDAAIIVHVRQGDPAGALLTPDVRLARLALRIERVELLVGPLLARLARVDGVPFGRCAS